MGLDQYAYVAARAGQQDEYYAADGEYKDGEWVANGKTKPREIAYWRKHPNLQGWMEQLYIDKTNHTDHSFNGIELELTWEDIEKLEQDIKGGVMSKLDTTGFFFGDPSDDYYREQDLEFIKNAKAELFCGLKVFYNSSW